MSKKIPIEEIEIGMIFSEPLYTGNKNSLIPAGVEITESDYNRLVRWGVKVLYTDGELIEKKKKEKFSKKNEEKKKKEDNNSDYVDIYNTCLYLYEEFIEKLENYDEFDKEKLDIIIKKIFDLIDSYKNDIIAYMGIENEEYDFIITHSINSTIIALIGGAKLNLEKKKLRHLAMAGLLHDIGMKKIPKNILNKKGKLDDEEYEIIKSHPITAYKQMNKSGIFNQIVLDAVLQHQEQFDGNGYPRKLKGDKISLFAKILAIADTFEAQISPRAYRASKTGYIAMKSVLAEVQNKFDPKVLRAFLTTLSIYPPGTLVQLNNNSIGAVIAINSEAPLRPQIKIIIDEFGERVEENILKDLKNENEIFIIRVLNKDEYT